MTEVTMGLEIIEGTTTVPEVIIPQRIDGEFVSLDTKEQFEMRVSIRFVDYPIRRCCLGRANKPTTR